MKVHRQRRRSLQLWWEMAPGERGLQTTLVLFAGEFAPCSAVFRACRFQGRRQLVGEAVCQGKYLANKFAPTIAAVFRAVNISSGCTGSLAAIAVATTGALHASQIRRTGFSREGSATADTNAVLVPPSFANEIPHRAARYTPIRRPGNPESPQPQYGLRRLL
jgi:hypothetical protein